MNVRIKFWTNFPKQKNLPVCDATSMWMLPREGRPLWVSSFSGKAHKIEFTPKLPGVVNPGLGELGVGRLVLIGALKEKLCHPAYSIFFFFFKLRTHFACLFLSKNLTLSTLCPGTGLFSETISEKKGRDG